MSFIPKYRTLRNGYTFDLQAHPKMSAPEKQSTAATDTNEAERRDETSTGFSTDVIERRIKANLEHLHARISALTQMMDKFIQGNLAREYPVASTRKPRFPSESPLTDGRGISRTLAMAALTTTGYSPDKV